MVVRSRVILSPSELSVCSACINALCNAHFICNHLSVHCIQFSSILENKYGITSYIKLLSPTIHVKYISVWTVWAPGANVISTPSKMYYSRLVQDNPINKYHKFEDIIIFDWWMPVKSHCALQHRKRIAFTSFGTRMLLFQLNRFHVRVLLLQKVGNRVKGWVSG